MSNNKYWRMSYSELGRAFLSGSFVFCLTDKQRTILLGWLESLRPAATWEDVEVGSAEYHLIQDELDTIYGSLCETMSMDLILSKLDEVIAAIEAIGGGTGGGCCDIPRDTVGGTSSYPSPYTLPVPQEIIDAGWATSETDYGGMGNYNCAAADLIIDSMIAKVDSFQEIWVSGLVVLGAVASILAAVWTGGVSLAIAIAFADAVAVYQAVDGIVAETVFDVWRDALEEMRETFRCLLAAGVSSSTLLAAVDSFSSLYGSPLPVLLSNMGWEPVVRAVYEAEFVSYVGDSRPCAANCESSVALNITGTVLSPAGWVSGDTVAVGQTIEVELADEVIGTTAGFRVDGQFAPVGSAAAVLEFRLLSGEFMAGSAGHSSTTDSLGVVYGVSLVELNSSFVRESSQFRLTSVEAFQTPVGRPIVSLTVLGVLV